jgi:membrane fusion protein (multidrug efflux system)
VSEKPEYSPAKPARRMGRRIARIALMVLGPLVLALAGGYYYVSGGRYVVTENAYVKADKIAISTNVVGRVVQVAVSEHDRVEPGQLLFRLDEQPFQIALDRAEAQIGNINQEIEAMRALYRQKQAELKVTQKDLAYFKREFGRQKELTARGVVSKSRFDRARRNLDTAGEKVLAIRQEIARVLASLGGDPKLPIDQHPKMLEALTQRHRTALELSWTVVRAPAAGIVTNNGLQVGEYVKEGSPIFSLVVVDGMWIEANLKETELTHVEIGQRATIKVDTYPDRSWPVTVESISPATGAEFSLLPPQNASGNWVKVVQRVPVKLKLVDAGNGPPLRAGMSVIVEIDTLHERKLPEFITSALAWVKGGEKAR